MIINNASDNGGIGGPVEVMADNRYRLYVNGEEVCYGPQLADPRHWRMGGESLFTRDK